MPGKQSAGVSTASSELSDDQIASKNCDRSAAELAATMNAEHMVDENRRSDILLLDGGKQHLAKQQLSQDTVGLAIDGSNHDE